MLLTWVFWLFKPLISAKTLAKFVVVGTGRTTIGKELLPTIPADQLPKKYGGEAENLGWVEAYEVAILWDSNDKDRGLNTQLNFMFRVISAQFIFFWIVLYK